MSEYRVTGPLEIAGKATGEMVELDESMVNVQVLIDAGHIEPVKAYVHSLEVEDPA